MIILAVVILVLVLLLAGSLAYAGWYMHREDLAQHAVPRLPVLRPGVAGLARHRTVPRAQTASQPPAELTDTPCSEPPPAPYLADGAATTIHAAAEAART